MEIHTAGGISGPGPVENNRISQNRIQPPKTESTRADRAEISDHARFLAKLREVPEVRLKKIEALRALIASGKYDTPERIRGAVEKLLEEIG